MAKPTTVRHSELPPSWVAVGAHPYLIAKVNRSCVMQDTPDSGGGPFYPAISGPAGMEAAIGQTEGDVHDGD